MYNIGLSACFFYPNPNRPIFAPKTLSFVENDMFKFITTEETFPFVIPDIDEKLQLNFLKKMDGLLLQGGNDICPETYGESGIENNRWPGDKYRDDYELKLIDYAFKNKIPILGICRGAQLLNCYFKGTLYQDLDLQTKTKVKHRDGLKYCQLNHQITLNKDSCLFEAYQQQVMQINSIHHQGIKDLGKDLIIEATSEDDNLIEAFRHKDPKSFVWGLQWHPEFSHTMPQTVTQSAPILKRFLAEVKKRKNP